jgi:hypothetical protein
MRKSRASVETFYDLKIGKYVEYLMHVSSDYLISCVLLSLTCMASRTSWIRYSRILHYNIYIARCPQPEFWKLYCAVNSISVLEASRFVTFEVKSRSQTPSP